MLESKKILKCGCGGFVVAALCCFTPVLVVSMAAVGLSEYVGWLDYVLFPVMVASLGMIVFALAWKKNVLPILHTIITCPQCEKKKMEQMPQNACQWFYKCSFCGVLLSPKEGDCCVFCSYGKDSCPPIQQGNSCCK